MNRRRFFSTPLCLLPLPTAPAIEPKPGPFSLVFREMTPQEAYRSARLAIAAIRQGFEDAAAGR